MVNTGSTKAREGPDGNKTGTQDLYSYLCGLAEQLVSPNHKAKAALTKHFAKEASR